LRLVKGRAGLAMLMSVIAAKTNFRTQKTQK